jgi:NADP oxidoreductase coenzyme F420-dependent
LTTAIIGVGNIGSPLARHLVGDGQAVVLAAKDESRAEALARAASVEDAIEGADVVVFAVWLDTMTDARRRPPPARLERRAPRSRRSARQDRGGGGTGMSATDTSALPDYAPVPRSALGPALNERGYYVGRGTSEEAHRAGLARVVQAEAARSAGSRSPSSSSATGPT